MSREAQVPATGEPKQKTPKGYEIPVPKRQDVMAFFRKVVRPKKP